MSSSPIPIGKLDAHAKPPDEIKALYKSFQKLKGKALDEDELIIDCRHIERYPKLRLLRKVKHEAKIEDHGNDIIEEYCQNGSRNVPIYGHDDMPGLEMIPDLVPPSTQNFLLDRLLHRDVSDPKHMSNLHLHYNVQYPPDEQSFFSLPPSTDLVQQPKDTSIHKPLNLQQFLNKKLRWITLGGQYDWTAKVYPDGQPPAFPPDIAGFLETTFPQMTPEAAILNIYSPGDTLSLHRDVAEECDQGLASISFGCDGIFILGLEDDDGACKSIAIRLRSGDAVFMDGKSRYAWHGVPQIVNNTCPDYLKDWPGEEYPGWKGWMSGKRINLNVRQMFD